MSAGSSLTPSPALFPIIVLITVCYYKRRVVSDDICLPDSNAELHEGWEAFPCVHVGVGNWGLAITMMGVEGGGR